MKNNSLVIKVGVVVVCLVVVGGSFFIGTYVGQSHASVDSSFNIKNKDTGKAENVDFSTFWKVWNLLDDKYVATHGVGTSTLALVSSTSTDQSRVYGAIKGMTESLGDPYTVFFPPAESKSFQDEIAGNFEGVGMELGIKDDILTVVSPLKNTPASRAGLLSGDKILKIDKTVTAGISIDESIKLIRGKKGTEVAFTIQRKDAEPFEVKVVRDTINVPTIDTVKRPDGIFVIRLYSFTGQSSDLFRNALRDFVTSNSKKLVLDLRGNPGGYLDAAVDMASWFLPAGKPVVRESFGEGKKEVVSSSRGYDIFNDSLKFVILVDGGSASASEILAGALHEYGKAKLVGTKTFGKGSVQELVQITPDTSLKVTIARWLTPNGLSISDNGITPDYMVNLTADDVKNQKDPQMDKAVEVLNQ
ncbi:MAG: S41 family peptidase [Candidatus Paceibacterota bacterium]|jgi:carboxyl-terminal processing protease